MKHLVTMLCIGRYANNWKITKHYVKYALYQQWPVPKLSYNLAGKGTLSTVQFGQHCRCDTPNVLRSTRKNRRRQYILSFLCQALVPHLSHVNTTPIRSPEIIGTDSVSLCDMHLNEKKTMAFSETMYLIKLI